MAIAGSAGVEGVGGLKPLWEICSCHFYLMEFAILMGGLSAIIAPESIRRLWILRKDPCYFLSSWVLGYD